MKKIVLLFLALWVSATSFSQTDVSPLFAKHPELIIKFQIQGRSQLETLTRMVSIDKVTENEVIAYVVQEEFEQFLTLNIPYEIVERPVLTDGEANMQDFEGMRNSKAWDAYPTYDAYVSMMYQFQTDYPELCRVVEFGTGANTSQNRKLLACVISANVDEREAEPQIFYSSSMHGDEIVGYVLMLRLIDTLLNGYGTNEQITNLLNNAEIWINPLANPDGTYYGGNNSNIVNNSRRNNYYNYDLNRNYPDWVVNNPTPGGTRQKETSHFMALQEQQAFVLGINIHGGSEVCNYPWDNTYTWHADDAWWQLVCWDYANTVHQYSPSNYLNLYGGVVRGANWYKIDGGRQDYTNYYDYNREFCLEISNSKNPSAGTLPTYWNYNHRSFLNFMEEALYGIHGVVTDACSGEPVYAKVFVNSHDVDNSFVMTDPRMGYYARPIKGGTYSVTYSAEGYTSQTVSITVADKQKVVKNISLAAIGGGGGGGDMPTANFEADVTEIFTNQTVQFTDLSENATTWEWYFEGGTPETTTEQNPVVLYENAGSFSVQLKVFNESTCSNEKTIKNYITVNPAPLPIANFEADKTTIFENETVSFTDISENNPTAWKWYLEGGTPETSTEQNPTVLYKNSGIYSVKLVVENNFGQDSITKEDYITVVETIMPIADFVADTTCITAGESVKFTNLSKNAIGWEWYFEGGIPETTTEQHPTVLYENAGSFDVKLTATNDEGSDEMLKVKYMIVIIDTVTIKEQKEINLKIYPNPTTGEVTITIPNNTESAQIEVFTLVGQKIHSGNFDNRKTIAITELGMRSKGVYFIRIKTNHFVETVKLVVE